MCIEVHTTTWHDITWPCMATQYSTWHDITRHDITWPCMARHYSTWHDITRHDIEQLKRSPDQTCLVRSKSPEACREMSWNICFRASVIPTEGTKIQIRYNLMKSDYHIYHTCALSGCCTPMIRQGISLSSPRVHRRLVMVRMLSSSWQNGTNSRPMTTRPSIIEGTPMPPRESSVAMLASRFNSREWMFICCTAFWFELGKWSEHFGIWFGEESACQAKLVWYFSRVMLEFYKYCMLEGICCDNFVEWLFSLGSWE